MVVVNKNNGTCKDNGVFSTNALHVYAQNNTCTISKTDARTQIHELSALDEVRADAPLPRPHRQSLDETISCYTLGHAR